MNEKMHEGMSPAEKKKHMKAMALKSKGKKKAKNPMDESKKHEAMKGDMAQDKGEYK